MKRFISVLLAVLLLTGAQAVSAAEEVSGITEMPAAGMRFTPPEEFRNAKGQVVTDGLIKYSDGIYYAYWVYCPMTEEELQAFFADPGSFSSAAFSELCYLLSLGNGLTFDDFNSMVDHFFDPARTVKIGQAGNTSFYLYMSAQDMEFAASIDPEYGEEYLKLTGLGDRIAGGVECFEPYDPLIGTKIVFAAKDLDGNEISSEELFAGNEINIVNIWATWCGPCIRELAELQRIHQRIRRKDCGVIGLLDDTNLDSARQLMTENGVEYPVIRAPENFYELFPIEAYPTTYFISRDGTVLASPVVGAYVDRYEEVLESLPVPKE